jgi:hypothetical protein
MDCEHECNYVHFSISDKWTRHIHMWTLYKIKSNSERTHTTWQQFIKTSRRMISRGNQILRPIDIGDNVTISIPSVDRGRGDPRNSVCLVTHISADMEQYKLGTRHGVLNSTFSRNKCMSSTLHGLS